MSWLHTREVQLGHSGFAVWFLGNHTLPGASAPTLSHQQEPAPPRNRVAPEDRENLQAGATKERAAMEKVCLPCLPARFAFYSCVLTASEAYIFL